MTTYVGIDPSLSGTAIVAIRDSSVVICQRYPSAPAGRAVEDRWNRLQAIVGQVTEVVTALGDPVHVLIESPAPSQTNGHHHDRSGLWWLLVNNLRGHCEISEAVPQVIKKYATGKGNAGKDEVLLAVAKRYPDAPITNNDEADALVLAAIAARLDGHPTELGLPKTHLDALRSLT